MKEDSLHSQRQDRLTSHSVNRTRLPRPGAPSSILVSYRLSLAAHPVVTRDVSARLRVLRTVPASPRPRACERDRQGIIGCPVNRWTMQHNTESGRTRELSCLCARSNPLNPLRNLRFLGRGAGICAGSRRPVAAFVPGMPRQQRATQNRKPLHSRREVHPAEVGGQLSGCRQCALSLLRGARTGSGANRVEDARVRQPLLREVRSRL